MIDRGELDLDLLGRSLEAPQFTPPMIDPFTGKPAVIDLHTGQTPVPTPLPAYDPSVGPFLAGYLWGDHELTCRAVLPHLASDARASVQPHATDVEWSKWQHETAHARLVDFSCKCGVTFRMIWADEATIAVGDRRPGCYYGIDYNLRCQLAILIEEHQIGQAKLPAVDGLGHALAAGDCVEMWDHSRNTGVLGYVQKVRNDYDAWGTQLIDILGGDQVFYAAEQGPAWRKLDRGRLDASKAQTIQQAIQSGELKAVAPPTLFHVGDYVQLVDESDRDDGALGRVEFDYGMYYSPTGESYKILDVRLVNGEERNRSGGVFWTKIDPNDPRALLIKASLPTLAAPPTVDDLAIDDDDGADEPSDIAGIDEARSHNAADFYAGVHKTQR